MTDEVCGGACEHATMKEGFGGRKSFIKTAVLDGF